MTTPRRRILRNAPLQVEIDRRHTAALQRVETRLTAERASLQRWLKRLRRAFGAVDRRLKAVARLEKTFALLRRA